LDAIKVRAAKAMLASGTMTAAEVARQRWSPDLPAREFSTGCTTKIDVRETARQAS
jgi:hypothetical protein